MGFRTDTAESIDFSRKIDAILAEDEGFVQESSGRPDIDIKGSLAKIGANTEPAPKLDDLTPEEKEKILEAKKAYEENRATRKQKAANRNAKVGHISKIAGVGMFATLIKLMDFIGRIICIVMLPHSIRCSLGYGFRGYENFRSKVFFTRTMIYNIASIIVKVALWAYVGFTFTDMFPIYILALLCVIIVVSKWASRKSVTQAVQSQKNKSVEAKQITAREVGELTDRDVARFYKCLGDRGNRATTAAAQQQTYQQVTVGEQDDVIPDCDIEQEPASSEDESL